MDVKDYNSVQAEILNKLYAEHKAKNNNGANVELPFGEKTVMGDTLTWDGDITGKVTTTDSDGNVYVKVSDATPKYYDPLGATYTWDDVDKQHEASPAAKDYSRVGNVDNYDSFIFVAFQDNETYTVYSEYGDYSITFPEKGIYFILDANMSGHSFIRSFTIKGYNGFPRTKITPLPNKYLDIVKKVCGDTLTWDEDITGKVTVMADDWGTYVKVADAILTYDDLVNGFAYGYHDVGYLGYCTYDDREYVSFTDNTIDIDEGSIMVILRNDVTYEGDGWNAHFPEKGIYFYYDPDWSITKFIINGYDGFETYQIKPNYGIPKIIVATNDNATRLDNLSIAINDDCDGVAFEGDGHIVFTKSHYTLHYEDMYVSSLNITKPAPSIGTVTKVVTKTVTINQRLVQCSLDHWLIIDGTFDLLLTTRQRTNDDTVIFTGVTPDVTWDTGAMYLFTATLKPKDGKWEIGNTCEFTLTHQRIL